MGLTQTSDGNSTNFPEALGKTLDIRKVSDAYENRDKATNTRNKNVENRDISDNRYREQVKTNRERNKELNSRYQLEIDGNTSTGTEERDIAVEERDKLSYEIVVKKQIEEVEEAYNKVKERQKKLKDSTIDMTKSISSERKNTKKEAKEMYPDEWE